MVPFLLWSIQVFWFCALMGLLAFDYRILRRHGYRVRELFLAHNVPALAAYGPTLIAALGSALVVWMTDGLTKLATFSVEQIVRGGIGGA